MGFEVIGKVPSILHTPLMSGTNAIHGVILVGAMIVLGSAHGAMQLTIGFLAVVLATLNVVGGFVVTDRMLEMFKGRRPSRQGPDQRTSESDGAREPGHRHPRRGSVAANCFILASRGSPTPKERAVGNLVGAAGMVLAIGMTFATPGLLRFV